uniref:hypothetical protein n=1 Tax=Micromonospora acroterricola TaxID=2202421 RepID=UPI00191BFABF
MAALATGIRPVRVGVLAAPATTALAAVVRLRPTAPGRLGPTAAGLPATAAVHATTGTAAARR